MAGGLVLVTGSGGFIGSNLLRIIEAEDPELASRLVLLSASPRPGYRWVRSGQGEGPEYRFTSDDLRSAGAEDIETVIHLGAFTPKGGAEANDVAGCLSNITNTHLLTMALARPPRRFVFASTLDVYGAFDRPAAETDPCSPASLYGQSKLFCERMLQALYPAGGGTQLAVLRIGHTYGRGEQAYRKLIPETIRRLIAGEAPLLTTSGDEKRAFIHVDDCCRMIMEAARKPLSESPINIASNTTSTIREIVGHLCEIAPRKLGGAPVPLPAPGTAKGRDVVMDVTRMTDLLGTERMTLARGLDDEFDSLLETAT